jgi:hypothetical protein
MPAYQYPFEDFVRDLVATMGPEMSAAASKGDAAYLNRVRTYLRDTYGDSVDAVERGAALGCIGPFLARHLDDFDTGKIAVSSPREGLVSMHLLRALHGLICPFAFHEAERMPTPAEVLWLAEQYAVINPGGE